MIRVELNLEESHGDIFEWWAYEGKWDVVAHGRSRTPLLDACREIKRMGGDPLSEIALFHDEATNDWTLRTTVGAGAALTVDDRPSGGGPKFARFQAFDQDRG